MKFISNWLDRWAFDRASRIAEEHMRKTRQDHPVFSERVESEKFSGAMESTAPKNDFTLHKAVNGHILEVWDTPGRSGPSNSNPVSMNGEKRTQQLYIVPEGVNVVEVVAQALVSNRLSK